MKTKLIYIGLIIFCSIISSCDYERIRAKGEVTTREVNFNGYSTLQVSDAFNVYVRFSDTEEKIEIEANENLHDRIVIEMEGPALRIKMRNHTSIKGNATLNAYITTKSIDNFDVSGASKVTLESELAASEGTIKLSGASEFIGEFNLGRLKLDASGASNADLFGKAGLLDASLSGASTLTNYDFVIGALIIRLFGASDAYLSVNETIDIDASGASKLNYKGDAVVNHKKLSGASDIVKK